ncbi:MAG: MarR family winged helix-turn-helix transcriptional regulator [Roseiarcus sp.]|jgi:DNA-binding MarR family transcriptional regulator
MLEKRLVDEIACNCLMGRARLVARVVTGIYEEELRPFGLKASQLNLLVVVAQVGPVRRSEVGRILRLDASTLTRNLQVMLTNGWIEEAQDQTDGRGLPLQIAQRGAALLADVAPAWRQAQRRARDLLGAEGSTVLTEVSNGLLGAASQ